MAHYGTNDVCCVGTAPQSNPHFASPIISTLRGHGQAGNSYNWEAFSCGSDYNSNNMSYVIHALSSGVLYRFESAGFNRPSSWPRAPYGAIYSRFLGSKAAFNGSNDTSATQLPSSFDGNWTKLASSRGLPVYKHYGIKGGNLYEWNSGSLFSFYVPMVYRIIDVSPRVATDLYDFFDQGYDKHEVGLDPSEWVFSEIVCKSSLGMIGVDIREGENISRDPTIEPHHIQYFFRKDIELPEVYIQGSGDKLNLTYDIQTSATEYEKAIFTIDVEINIIGINIVNPGQNYSNLNIIFSSDLTGDCATCECNVSNGALQQITMINFGRYASIPRYSIVGDGQGANIELIWRARPRDINFIKYGDYDDHAVTITCNDINILDNSNFNSNNMLWTVSKWNIIDAGYRIKPAVVSWRNWDDGDQRSILVLRARKRGDPPNSTEWLDFAYRLIFDKGLIDTDAFPFFIDVGLTDTPLDFIYNRDSDANLIISHFWDGSLVLNIGPESDLYGYSNQKATVVTIVPHPIEPRLILNNVSDIQCSENYILAQGNVLYYKRANSITNLFSTDFEPMEVSVRKITPSGEIDTGEFLDNIQASFISEDSFVTNNKRYKLRLGDESPILDAFEDEDLINKANSIYNIRNDFYINSAGQLVVITLASEEEIISPNVFLNNGEFFITDGGLPAIRSSNNYALIDSKAANIRINPTPLLINSQINLNLPGPIIVDLSPSRITPTSMTYSIDGEVGDIAIEKGGSWFNNAPNVKINGLIDKNGEQAEAIAIIEGPLHIDIDYPGFGYKYPPKVGISGIGIPPTTLEVVLDNQGSIRKINYSIDSKYSILPQIYLYDQDIEEGGANAILRPTLNGSVKSIKVTNRGKKYLYSPDIIIDTTNNQKAPNLYNELMNSTITRKEYDESIYTAVAQTRIKYETNDYLYKDGFYFGDPRDDYRVTLVKSDVYDFTRTKLSGLFFAHDLVMNMDFAYTNDDMLEPPIFFTPPKPIKLTSYYAKPVKYPAIGNNYNNLRRTGVFMDQYDYHITEHDTSDYFTSSGILDSKKYEYFYKIKNMTFGFTHQDGYKMVNKKLIRNLKYNNLNIPFFIDGKIFYIDMIRWASAPTIDLLDTIGNGATINVSLNSDNKINGLSLSNEGNGQWTTNTTVLLSSGNILFEPAEIECLLNETGSVTGVVILNQGYGYFPNILPSVNIDHNTGHGLRIKPIMYNTVLPSGIAAIEILNPGIGYSGSPSISIANNPNDKYQNTIINNINKELKKYNINNIIKYTSAVKYYTIRDSQSIETEDTDFCYRHDGIHNLVFHVNTNGASNETETKTISTWTNPMCSPNNNIGYDTHLLQYSISPITHEPVCFRPHLADMESIMSTKTTMDARGKPIIFFYGDTDIVN